MNARLRFLLLTMCGLAVLMALFMRISVAAAPAIQESTPTPAPEQLSIANEVCLGCHSAPGQTYPLANGELLDLYVPAETYAASVHGQLGYACVQCHRTVGEYPHPPFQPENLRQATLQLNQACQTCHSLQADLAQDGVHAAAQQIGNLQAATCSDCHGSHDIRRLNDPKTRELTPEARLWIPQTCARCHSLIYEKYKESVHGAALTNEGNQDVPTCIDCHGVHNMEDPRTTAFRLKSPQICARCHTNPQVVGKYGLSTEVLNTYVADFHGTTVMIFERQSPDAEVNKPVCYDCHGIHDIKRTSDPEKGLQVKENLLARCQVCHPDASTNFPDAWLSHYIPSPEKAPLVYYVNLFYKFFIPGTLGFMATLVVLDFSRRMLNQYRRQSHAPAIAESEASQTETVPVSAEQAPLAAASPEPEASASVIIPEISVTEEPSIEPAVAAPEQATPEPAPEASTADESGANQASDAAASGPTDSATPATEE